MSDAELAALLVDMIRDWLKHTSDGWFRLSNFLDAMEIDIQDGKPWGDFEQRVYAQLDKWEQEAGQDGA